MAINSIPPLKTPQVNANTAPARVAERPATETVQQVQQRKDVLELSGQNQPVRENNRNEMLQRIQTQMSSGYYNRPEVLQETASRIALDLQSGAGAL
jgi:LAS superfamily LD-carboxypeptidase LdcB